MLGTIRTLDNGMKATVLKRLEEIVYNVAKSNNIEANITYLVSYPITFNDPYLYEEILPTLERVNGKKNVRLMKAITGAEDFSYFQEKFLEHIFSLEVKNLVLILSNCSTSSHSRLLC